MKDTALLRQFGAVPLTHHNLEGVLQDYRRPNDKIRDWIEKGWVIPLMRGRYIVSPNIHHSTIPLALLANSLYGPSYVSVESALSEYGAIPEGVQETTSVTTRRSRMIANEIGRFRYVHVPEVYFGRGIRIQSLNGNLRAMIATPEKALLDQLICTRNLRLRSQKDAQLWMEDMRLDEEWLASLDLKKMLDLAKFAPKQNSIHFLIHTMNRYGKGMDQG